MNNQMNPQSVRDKRLMANYKWRRINTLIKKSIEISEHTDFQINVVVFKPQFNKLVENYTNK